MTTIVDPHSLAPTPARLGPRSAFNGSQTNNSACSEAQRLRRTSKIAILKKSSPVESFYSRLERRPAMDEKPRGKPLLVILSVVFLDLVGIGILIPIVPIPLAGPRSPSICFQQDIRYKQDTYFWLAGCHLPAVPVPRRSHPGTAFRQIWKKNAARNISHRHVYFVHHFCLRHRHKKHPPPLFGERIRRHHRWEHSCRPSSDRRHYSARTTGKELRPSWCSIWLRLYCWSLYRWKAFRSLYCQLFTAATPFWFAALLSAMNVVS